MTFRQLFDPASKRLLPKWEQVCDVLKKQIEQDNDWFRHRLAVEITDVLDPEKIVPEEYDRFTPLVRDGLIFFFSRINQERLFHVLEEQYRMSRDTSLSSRCFRIVLNFPTLHKLCQILARNKHVHPEIKLWLTRLEAGKYGRDDEEASKHVSSRLAGNSTIHLEKTIYAEASVGIVFRYRNNKAERTPGGVVKCLKPGIRAKVEEELAILSALADRFDQNRERYALNQLQYKELFDDLKRYLIHEIDLAQEQNQLRQARAFWSPMKNVSIPRLRPSCTRQVTVMDFLEGEKITESQGNRAEKKAYAELLAEALILRPLFSRREKAIFHGDPHAGNLLALECGPDRKLGIIDWSLAGYLSRQQRKQIIAMVLGIVTRNGQQVNRAVNMLRRDRLEGDGCFSQGETEKIIRELFRDYALSHFSILHRTFSVIEELSLSGVVFPPELVLFRKAFFTLEGVLNDLDPHLDLDNFLMRNLNLMLIAETPTRYRSLCLFLPDRAEDYSTLISNGTLYRATSQILCNIVTDYTRTLATIAQSNLYASNSMYRCWLR